MRMAVRMLLFTRMRLCIAMLSSVASSMFVNVFLLRREPGKCEFRWSSTGTWPGPSLYPGGAAMKVERKRGGAASRPPCGLDARE